MSNDTAYGMACDNVNETIMFDKDERNERNSKTCRLPKKVGNGRLFITLRRR